MANQPPPIINIDEDPEDKYWLRKRGKQQPAPAVPSRPAAPAPSAPRPTRKSRRTSDLSAIAKKMKQVSKRIRK